MKKLPFNKDSYAQSLDTHLNQQPMAQPAAPAANPILQKVIERARTRRQGTN
jgi:hypothetical protein